MSDLNPFRIRRAKYVRQGALMAILGTLIFLVFVYPGVPLKGVQREQLLLQFLAVASVTGAIGAWLGYRLGNSDPAPPSWHPPVENDTRPHHSSNGEGVSRTDDKICGENQG
jgi:hypothetical protein